MALALFHRTLLVFGLLLPSADTAASERLKGTALDIALIDQPAQSRLACEELVKKYGFYPPLAAGSPGVCATSFVDPNDRELCIGPTTFAQATLLARASTAARNTLAINS